MAQLQSSGTVSTTSTFCVNRIPLAELKNGKVFFKQKPLSFEKASETMQEIVKFREMLDRRVESQDPPLTCIPDEYKPLIVKLAQESDKSVVPLAKHIRSIILPGQGEADDAQRTLLESCLPLPVVEYAITTVMTRTNYGLDASPGCKLPAALCVWRWEVQEAYKDWLPKSAKEKVEARAAERIQAKMELCAAFESLPQAERDTILGPKGTAKFPVKDADSLPESADTVVANADHTEVKLPKDLDLTADDNLQSDDIATIGRPKKIPDSEKAIKAKEKEAQRAAKAAKEKKQKEGQDRSRSFLANFVKAKPPTRNSPKKDANAVVSPLLNESDFQRTFRPFTLKKDAELAPHNRFLEVIHKSRAEIRRTGATQDEAIVIDDDAKIHSDNEIVSNEGRNNKDSEYVDPRSMDDILQMLRHSSLSFPARRRLSSFKTHHRRSVRDVMVELNDAEIAGDPSQVRRFLSILNDRKVLPAKVLIFHTDARPGYYGTWTRNSRTIGPRTPFERDLLAHDYMYDSGEEWEDEGTAEGDDVIDDAEDDEPDNDDADSDLDSWLVDDDEVDVEPSLDPQETSSYQFNLSLPTTKRKAEDVEKSAEKKRKVVVPLVPYTKGPLWESSIGQCQYGPFEAYRIQLFNDTPYPVDPFTFVSVTTEERRGAKFDTNFAVPSLLDKRSDNTGLAGSSTVASVKRPNAGQTPKTTFPDAHLRTLLLKMNELATPNLAFLVDSIYQDLRVHKIKKNAIEAKVREIGEKSKDKIWVVKQGVQTSPGPTRPLQDIV